MARNVINAVDLLGIKRNNDTRVVIKCNEVYVISGFCDAMATLIPSTPEASSNPAKIYTPQTPRLLYEAI